MLVIQPDVPGLEWAICSQEGTFGTKQRLSEQEMMYGHPTWLSLPPSVDASLLRQPSPVRSCRKEVSPLRPDSQALSLHPVWRAEASACSRGGQDSQERTSPHFRARVWSFALLNNKIPPLLFPLSKILPGVGL